MVGISLSYTRRWRFDLAMAGGLSFAGVDEVGRGCLAGPVVAAAVSFDSVHPSLERVYDSKQLSPKRRQMLFDVIHERARAVAVGVATVQEIDDMNILHASRLAMGRALQKLDLDTELALVDGNVSALTDIACLPIVSGDVRSISIAAASIVAKVYRDRLMIALHDEYPMYGFANNVGYGTKEHRVALMQHGPSPYHRLTFAPVRESRHMQTRLLPNG